MLNLAAVVSDLGPSQKCFYLIKEFNKAATSKDVSISVFYNRPAIPVVTPHFSCKNISFLSGYHGVAIATTLPEAQTLLRACNDSKKYLYLWDLEWLYGIINFEAACDVLLDNRLTLIARSESHATIINNFCNKKVSGVVRDWNIGELHKIITEEQQ